jgi:hypothetical protein
MVIPIKCEDLFELNSNLNPVFDGEVITIDNIFKNYEQILQMCNNSVVEMWKSTKDSRNFIDYYDCKLTFRNWFNDPSKTNQRLNTLLQLTSEYFKTDTEIYAGKEFEFNYYKNKIPNLSNKYQHHPHTDYYYNSIIYIDTISNGGTAIYEPIEEIELLEEVNMLRDISQFKIKKLIKSIPNRCVIFPGHMWHGGYIENHNKYYHDWRINLVHFFEDKTQ